MARDSVLLLEKLGCRVNFPEKQGVAVSQPSTAVYIKGDPRDEKPDRRAGRQRRSDYLPGGLLHLRG